MYSYTLYLSHVAPVVCTCMTILQTTSETEKQLDEYMHQIQSLRQHNESLWRKKQEVRKSITMHIHFDCCILWNVQCMLYLWNVQCVLHFVECTLYVVFCGMYSECCILWNLQCVLYFAQLEERIKELEGEQSDLTPQQQTQSQQDDDVSWGLSAL